MVNYEVGCVNGYLKIVNILDKVFTVDCLKCDNKGVSLSKRQIRTNRSCGLCKKRIPIGKTYGRLFVKSLVEGSGQTKFICLCACGNKTTKTLQTLQGGKLPSCGCIGGNLQDITGKKLNSLTAIRNTFKKSSNKDYIWNFLCECGSTIETSIGNFNSGQTKSCGCAVKASRKFLKNYHGMTKSPEHNSWRKMRERCLSPSCKDFPYYGGKGVTVCPSWNTFKSFYKDMGDKPEPNYTIDRINSEGDYTKDNCRWASPYTQARNQKSYHGVTSSFKGVHYRKQDNRWVAKISINRESCIIGTYKEEYKAAKAYNTATKLLFEGNLSVTHLTEDSEYIEIESSSKFKTYWLPRFRNLVQELYEKSE